MYCRPPGLEATKMGSTALSLLTLLRRTVRAFIVPANTYLVSSRLGICALIAHERFLCNFSFFVFLPFIICLFLLSTPFFRFYVSSFIPTLLLLLVICTVQQKFPNYPGWVSAAHATTPLATTGTTVQNICMQ